MISRKTIYAIGIGGALGASLVVGGVVNSSVNVKEGYPMTGEETIIQEPPVPEETSTPVVKDSEVVPEKNSEKAAEEAPKKAVEEPVEPKTVTPIAEPEPTAPKEPELKDDCEAITNYIMREYGTVDFYEALGSLHGGLAKEQLKKLGLESWAQVKEFFGKNKHSVDANLTYGDVKKLVDLEPAYKVRCGA